MSQTAPHPRTIAHREKRRAQLASLPPGTDRLLKAAEAAALRSQGLSTFWRDVARGTAPKPVYIAKRSPRWWASGVVPSTEPSLPAA